MNGYVDSDYAGSMDTRRSIIGYVFIVLGGCVSRKSNLQKVLALSSIEIEYMATIEAIKKLFGTKISSRNWGLNLITLR